GRGLHVFMEKPFACDPPGVRRIIRAGEEAKMKNLKIAAGLMCRHSVARDALVGKIRAGELGEIQLIRVYRMGPVGLLGDKQPGESELRYQIRNYFRFFWPGGGLFHGMTIHQIDELCWIKGQLPVMAHGIGARAPKSPDRSQNFDSYSIEYTFGDGTKGTVGVRYVLGTHGEFATYVHGTRRAAQFSGNVHASTARVFKDHRISKENVLWEAEPEKFSLYQTQWNDLIAAIRDDK